MEKALKFWTKAMIATLIAAGLTWLFTSDIAMYLKVW